MISFASSIWLWALAGIALPVLIHLWNVRKGRTKKIGSIIFFTETAVSRARSLQLSDLFLLLIRCLLFIMIAFFIARPFLPSVTSSDQKGWVLMEKSRVGDLYREYGREIDSLLDKGFELHQFAGDFGLMKLSDSSGRERSDRGYWNLVRQLENRVPAGVPVFIYTGAQLNRFEGERPKVSLNLQWKTSTADIEASWIESAYVSYDDSVVMVLGKGTGKGTSFSNMVLPKAAIRIRENKPEIEFEGKSAPVDTSTMKIGIYAESGTNDGRYLTSAIEAAREFSGRKIEMITLQHADKPESLDWVFWLSAQAIPEQVQATYVFAYEGQKSTSVHTDFSLEAGSSLIPVYRVYSPVNTAATKTWTTGVGDTILAFDGKANRYLFYSRFDPAWNEWVWQEEFPKFVMDLLYPQVQSARIDNRMIDPLQLMPVISKGKSTATASIRHDVSSWFWFLAFAVFVLERMLVYRRQNEAVNG